MPKATTNEPPRWSVNKGTQPTTCSVTREMTMALHSHPRYVSTLSQQDRIALFWLTTGIAAVMFVTFQLFFYINDFVRAQEATPVLMFKPSVLWVFPVFYGGWIVTVLLALIGTRSTQWGALLLGSLMVVINTAGGISDGLRDGWSVAVCAIFFITLPGGLTIIATWRYLKGQGVQQAEEDRAR
ncbi:hypothetical protein [Vibrio zhugei]|nr:hypothetical protein [Vibrio zhugei]